MSLVSRTSSDLFATLMSRRNAEEVALKFFQEHMNDSTNMNVQLTDLVFRCCGLTRIVNVPHELIRDENVTEIVNVVKKSIIPTSDDDTSKLSVDKKYLDKALNFFESFPSHYWCTFPDDEAPFFKNLIFALSKIEFVPAVQFSCNRILSKLVTSQLKNYDNIPDQRIGSLYDLIHSVMVDSFSVRSRQLLKMSLAEFERWLFIRPEEIIDDNFLRYLTWSLKDTSGIVLIGLHILERLLSDCENLPKRFVQQCGISISIMDVGESDEIFARVCECCVKIQSKFGYPLPNNFDQKLTEHLFALHTNRSVAAADYWLALNYDANDPVQGVRNLISGINSLPTTCLKYLDYFVDALIDKCPLLTHWNLLAKMLADKCERKLTAAEKDVLLMIVVHAAEQTVTGKKPRGRIDNGVHDANNEAAKTRRNVSSAFGPQLAYLFKTPDIDPSLLLKLLTFFDFNTMSVAMKEMLVNSCQSSFEVVGVSTQRVILEVLWAMKMNCEDATARMCFETVVQLKKKFETQVKDAFDDLLENPDDYLNPVNGKRLSNAFLALRIIDAVVPVEKSIAFDATITLMKRDPPARWNPTFMMVREVCVITSTQYVTRNLKKASFQTDTGSDKSSLSPSAKEAILLAMYFGNQLIKWHGGRNGLVIFSCLCDLASLFKEKGAIDKFPKMTINEMCRFFLVALSQPDTENMNEGAMRQFLRMIGEDIIPMEYAYHALSVHCNVDDVKYIRCLQQFLEEQCVERGSDFMVEWMTKLWIRLYEGKSAERLEEGKRLWQTYEKIRDLIYSVRFKMENFVRKCHIAGIEYAVSEAERVEFARILSIFSPCLSLSNRLLVLKYARAKNVDAAAMRLYVGSLKKKENLKAVIVASPAHGSTGGASSRATSVDLERSPAPRSSTTPVDETNFFDDDGSHVGGVNANESRSLPRRLFSSDDSPSTCSPIPRLNDGDNSNENRFVPRIGGDDNSSNYSPVRRSSDGENLSESMEVDSNDDPWASSTSLNPNRKDSGDYISS